MPAITAQADGEEPATAATGFLAEGWIHDVGARAGTSDWTTSPNAMDTN